jgi:catechol 2,3-dioxygenase-like lactoylglutathione lyase family enzyme
MMNRKPLIAGIQQVGLGIACVHSTWRWYRENLGFDIPVFNEAAEAGLMLPYTGGRPRKRHAILALNLRGGGGLEIWQYTERQPLAPEFQPQLGDLGIFILKLKSSDVPATHRLMKESGNGILGEITANPAGQQHFFMNDPHGNLIEIVEGNSWFTKKSKRTTGGVYGCVIGVSDIDKSLPFYQQILGCDTVVFDEKNTFGDLACLPGGDVACRRVLLRHSDHRRGAFSKLLGDYEIELVEVKDRKPRKIFEDRYWGDLGFIHLCFDINGMEAMKRHCETLGHPFTVDSSKSFDMGEAAGHFSYVEDPDGTLIEFVETHKLPLLKKLGWYLDLRKRPPGKALPNWMLRTLSLNRVK